MRILLAVDGSEPSTKAAHMLSTRPWPKDSTLRVLVVVQPVYTQFGGTPFFPETIERMTQQLMISAEAILAQTVASLRDVGLPIETAVRPGDPRTEIVADAEEQGADLVVLGSHGRTGLKRWLLGSVAEHVVRYSPCSVEVVRGS